jgi:hypothetical protein
VRIHAFFRLTVPQHGEHPNDEQQASNREREAERDPESPNGSPLRYEQ